MSAPVTAEELAAAERCAKSLLSIFPYHAEHAGFGGVSRDFHALAVTATERAAELLPRLARDLATARASIRGLIEALDAAQTDLDTERKALSLLADRNLDLGREMESLRADSGERITKAAAEIARYGMVDGAHHKQWLLDRVLRLMLTEGQYATWVAEMNSDPDYAPWDVGIAP